MIMPPGWTVYLENSSRTAAATNLKKQVAAARFSCTMGVFIILPY